MRIATAVIIALALLAAPASAQFGGGAKRNHGGDDRKNEAKTPKVDEKAYKAALERIPEPKEKYDPWGVARPANPAKTPK
jgi:hypothetical protein